MSVKIRLASKKDAPQILEIYSPIVRLTHISFEHDVPDASEIAERIAKTLRQYPWLVCEIDARIAGYAYASAFRSRRAYQWTTETTVYVHEGYQRRGVSRALYASLLAILRAQGYRSAVGVIALPNAASIKAHEALGFQEIGVFRNVGFKAGAWRDTGWWQLDLSPTLERPPAPQSISDLVEQDGFDELLQTGLPGIRI
ncbi:MAG: GNAT family N-acetyltransferase [Chloroflexota bacterium]|nr:GNAT family N-acetyltransferase [Chloroflexota bacterium]